MKDKRRYPILIYIFLVSLLLAVQAADFISIYGFGPDFILILTINFSFLLGSFHGQLVAFALGLLLDSMSGGIFGLNAFIMVLVSSCSWLFIRLIKMPGIIVFLLYLMLATPIKYALYFFFYILLDKTNLSDWGFILQIPGEIILNLVFGVPLYVLFSRIDHREKYEWF